MNEKSAKERKEQYEVLLDIARNKGWNVEVLHIDNNSYSNATLKLKKQIDTYTTETATIEIDFSILNNEIQYEIIEESYPGLAVLNLKRKLDENFRKNKNEMATKKKTKKGLIWRIVGIIGSIASIAGLLLYFLPFGIKKAPQLTVFVTDVNGNVVIEHKGELNTSLGNRSMRETIGEDGRTNFGDILPEHLGDTITIGFKANGWELAETKNTFVFDGEPIKLRIKKDNSLGIIKGTVKTRDGQGFIIGANVRINSDTIIKTDENGIFKITLPASMQVAKATEGYLLTVSADGFQTLTQYHYPKSSDAEIRLKKR